MYDLNAIAALEKIYQNRSLYYHNESTQIQTYDMQNGVNFHVILDTSLSDKILKSKNFSSFNFFKQGISRLNEKGINTDQIEYFFNFGLLFRTGEQHLSIKKDMLDELNHQINLLDQYRPELKKHFLNRSNKYTNIHQFSRILVDFVFAKVTAELLELSFHSVLRVLKKHKNIFFFYFHVLRLKKLTENLALLKHQNSKSSLKVNIAQSLMIMGRDPLVSSICAASAGRDENIVGSVDRYCPVAETKRICNADIELGNTIFKKGDVLSINLLPAKSEKKPKKLGFGGGLHVCTGKRLAKWVLILAQEILESDAYLSIDKKACPYQEGALLLYKETD